MKGIYKNISNEEYHAEVDHLSSSNYKDLMFDIETFHNQKILKIPRISKQRNTFDEGTYAHSLILEPELIPDEFAMWENFRKSNSKGTKDWDIFKEANKDKIILSKPQRKRVESWVANYEKVPAAVDMINDCEYELSLFGEFHGIKTKVRADALNVEKGYIADVKTSAYDTDQESFKLVVDQFKYNLSAALYCAMFELEYGKPFDFYFVVLGKKDNRCEIFKLSEKSKQEGLLLLRKAVKKYKICKETGNWSDEKQEIVQTGDYQILEV